MLLTDRWRGFPGNANGSKKPYIYKTNKAKLVKLKLLCLLSSQISPVIEPLDQEEQSSTIRREHYQVASDKRRMIRYPSDEAA